MVRPAVQLYSLRDVEKSLAAIVELVADAGFEGVEFAYRAPEADASAVVTTLDDLGVVPVAAHVPIDDVEADPSDAAALYRELGCETLVVPYLEEGYFESVADVERAAQRLAAVADALAGPGLDLLYHNHDHEFALPESDGRRAGRTAFDALVAATDDRVGFELDVGHVARAGVDPVDVLERHGDRITLLHFTDVGSDGEPVALGEGVVDLAGCVEAYRASGGEWLIYEYEGRRPVATVEEAGETIRRFL